MNHVARLLRWRALTATLFALSLAATAAHAQDAPSFGVLVLELQTNKPVVGANVTPLDHPERARVTDAEGRFRIPAQTGETTLRVRIERIGYEPLERTLQVGDAVVQLRSEAIPVEGIEVTSNIARADKSPSAFTNVDRATIEREHYGQDLPMLLTGEVPGTYAYSDAGNGIGYSYLKIRGFAQRRIGVTINGIPLNDPQSREVYWIDHPDLAASAQNVQVQRGVGAWVYGTTALGGSVAVETIPYAMDRSLILEAGGGSFDTQRYALRAQSGLIDGKWSLSTRLSRIKTGGYREQSWSDLWSYFASVARLAGDHVLRVNLYGGPERTHLAYLGVPRDYLDGTVTGNPEEDRRFNPLQYPNERDHFFEPHYEVLHDWKLSNQATLSNALFYFQGTGYYDEFRSGVDLRDYAYDDSIVTDVVRRRNAKNLQVGWVPRLRFTPGGALTWEAGLDLRYHEGKRWGELLWAAQQPPNPAPDHTYYEYLGTVTNTSGFVRATWQAAPRLVVNGDLALHSQRYQLTDDAFHGLNFDETYTFLMPRAGATWQLVRPLDREALSSSEPLDAWALARGTRKAELYASYSRGEAEPIFRELYDPENNGVPPGFASLDPATGRLSDPLIDPENVDDWALGVRGRMGHVAGSLGGYFMNFKDEIVYNGRIDDNGNPITGNAARSRHAGVEGAVEWNATRAIDVTANGHWSDDRFEEYVEYVDATTGIDYSGNRIAGFPVWGVRGTVRGRAGRGTLELTVEHADRQYLDNTENERKNPAVRDDPSYVDKTIEPWTALHAAVTWMLPDAWGAKAWELSFRVNNLFDAHYETAGYIDYPAPAYAPTPVWIPAATRGFFAGLKTTF